mmetsp:Transcript_67334/g.111953  ORF Transcript_67334/g.111953 Transcript_67334/m.111953 type:complete len:205 (+) Transcript_67334:342-956(+)
MPLCILFEAGSRITHVVRLPDGANCFLKPVYAAATAGGFVTGMAQKSICTLDRNCKCCRLVRPGAALTGVCDNFQSADLRNVNMEGVTIENADITCASFDGAKLSGAVLRGVKGTAASFAGADLEYTNLEQSILVGANFNNANLRGANMQQAALEFATFEGADVGGVNFHESIVKETSFMGALGTKTADFSLAEGIATAKGLKV